MKTALYVSPHFDDVALSCAGHIISARENGIRCVVATVFSAGGGDRESSEYYAQRRSDDERAWAALEAETTVLGFPDAPFRNAYYRSFKEIIFGEHPEDEKWKERIAEALAALVGRYNPEFTYVPLAVGTHIDHRLVFEAASGIARPESLRFYEDRPYAFISGAVGSRLRSLGFRALGSPPDLHLGSALLKKQQASIRRSAFLQSYLPQEPRERLECIRLLLRKLRWPEARTTRDVRPLLLNLSLAHQTAALGPISAYQSEFAALFCSTAHCIEEYTEYSRLLTGEDDRGGWVERVWEFC